MDFMYAMGAKIVLLILLIGVGVLLKQSGRISDCTLEDLSRINVDIFWPALILYSIVSGLNRNTLIENSLLPVFAVITALVGLLLGLAFTRFYSWSDARKAVFLYHSTINNFVFIVLPFITFFLPKDGAALLFVHNLGYTAVLWTIGISFFTHSMPLKERVKHLLSNGLIVTFLGIFIVFLGYESMVPALLLDILKMLGDCTVPIAMIIAGAQIAKLGFKAFKFDAWNIQLGLIRLVLVPGLLAVLTVYLMKYTQISRQLLIVFMTVNLAPVSVNSVSIAIRYKGDADLAAEGVVFTHLFCFATMLFFFFIMKDFFTMFL